MVDGLVLLGVKGAELIYGFTDLQISSLINLFLEVLRRAELGVQIDLFIYLFYFELET